MFVFGSSPGIVGTVVSGRPLPFAVYVGGNQSVPRFGSVLSMKAVITNFSYEGQTGLGVSHTLRDRIYVYVFGERAARATVSGIAFAGTCVQQGVGPYTGFDAVFAYYEACRASTQGLAVRLVFSPYTALYGFMSDFQFRLEDPQSGAGSFSFGFVVMPRNYNDMTLPVYPWTVPSSGN